LQKVPAGPRPQVGEVYRGHDDPPFLF
jgi:hypothetical protein